MCYFLKIAFHILEKKGESEKNPSMFEEEDANRDSSEGPVITFGDDLDVPAFIRNRQG